MEKVILGGEREPYRVPFTPSTPKSALLLLIQDYMDDSKTLYQRDAFDYHGESPELNEIETAGIEICLEIARRESVSYQEYKHNSWINRVRAKSPTQYYFKREPYHNHVKLNRDRGRFEPKYTFIYYVQMPNRLQGEEGQLLLKSKQGETYSIMPKENEFIVHASSIDHYPKPALDSTVDRIVLASNVGFL
jgi:hypothetical protein